MCWKLVSIMQLKISEEDLPATNSKRSTLSPTLNAAKKTSEPAQLQSAISDSAHEEVKIILDQVTRSLQHDVDAESASKARVAPV
jgi:hypothetical protein